MGNETWLTPSKLLLLRNCIIDAKNTNRFIPPRNQDTKRYLDYITTEFTSGISQSRGSHIPFSRVTHTNVNSIATKITGLIGSNLNHQSILILKYCINELLSNVVEHSCYHNSFIIMQNYPHSSKLELAIMDDGISIPGNFEKYGISFTNDSDSLDKAFQGVSTKQQEEGRGQGIQSVFRVLVKGLEGEGVIISRNGIFSNRFVPSSRLIEKTLYTYNKKQLDIATIKGCFVAFSVRNDGLNCYLLAL